MALDLSIQEQKAGMRKRLRLSIQAVSSERRAALARALCALLVQQDAWRRAERVLFYASLEHEPDISPLVAIAVGGGKAVCLPRFEPGSSDYTAYRVTDLASDCVSGKFCILEPKQSCVPVSLNQLDLVLVPGVGFDLLGHRLGRGGGFYDRLLAQVSGIKCGVAFDEQVVDAIPVEPHDVSLNCILTPARWHRVAG